MSVNVSNYIEKAEESFMKTYIRQQIVLEKGEGVYLYDIDNKQYLDFAAGIAVFAFGYNNKDYNNALKSQLDKIIHTSNLYYNIPSIEAGEKFLKLSKMDKIFFTNSGTEAIEGAIKLARKYFFCKNKMADSEIISMNNSFHGRSIGALSVTGQPKYREAFKPLIGGVVFAEFNNINSIKEKITNKTSAIIVETIQGEGGLYPADKGFLQELRKICDEKDIVLILDEIQCGMGRCGTMFAYEQYGIKPDIVASAKALGCGIPVGAFAAVEKIASAFKPGDHGTTYGGNPFATAAVSKVLDMFEETNILENVKEVGMYLKEKLEDLVNKYDFILECRGIGLMQALEFNKEVSGIISKALEKGLIIISAGPKTIRFVPPLIIEKKHVDEMIHILEECLVV